METRRGSVVSTVALVALALWGLANGAVAAEITVLSAGAVKAAVVDLAEAFRRETGHSVKFTFATVGVLQQKVAAGEAADLLIMSDGAIEELGRKGAVAAGTKTDIARVGVGVCVRDGSPVPDISTPEALKRVLLSARSIVYMDPAKGGTSGIYFAGVLERMGIADAMKGKTTLWPEGYAAEPVAKGEVELCVHQMSEILAVKGVRLVGPLPRELQRVTIYSTGVTTGAAVPEAAMAFVAFLMSPSARAKLVATGLDYTE
jgi:molybdate transport system substrate-binding protein